MSEIHLGVLVILGMSVFGGMMGAWLFQRLRIPQVVGYIAIGLLIGESGLRMVTHDHIEQLRPFNLFALGIIGFLVGGELKIDTFKKYGKQFSAILLGEGLGAFFLVGVPATIVMYYIVPDFPTALASGIVFGAIASATDPASTIDVLWEYRAQGILTTSVTAIVALDDALAMSLYGLGTGAAQMLTSESGSIVKEMEKISVELLGAIVVGFIFCLILNFILKHLHQPEKTLGIAIGLILLLIGISARAGMDVILAAMTLGFALTNMAPRRSEELFKIVRSFSGPIYVLFFVMVGARLGVSNMPGWLWGIVAIYVIGRSVGKMSGAWIGAKATGSDKAVQRYLGLGLFAQGGVAVGLSIMASQHLAGIRINDSLSLGDAIIFAITATTLIVQLAGPPLVKLAITLAGESGKKVTDEDVISEWKVKNVMDSDAAAIPEATRLSDAVSIFAQNEYTVYPVVNSKGALAGMISLSGIRSLLVDQDSWQWLVASDVMHPVTEKALVDSPLSEIIELMRDLRIDQMPVVEKDDGERPAGMLDMMRIRKRISEEVIRRRQPTA